MTSPSLADRARVFGRMNRLDVLIKRALQLLTAFFPVRPMARRRGAVPPLRAGCAFDFHRSVPKPFSDMQGWLFHLPSFPQAAYNLLPLTPSSPRVRLYPNGSDLPSGHAHSGWSRLQAKPCFVCELHNCISNVPRLPGSARPDSRGRLSLHGS
jgi:hypothetical protein